MVNLGTIVLFLRISLRPIGCKRENPNILCSNETKELQHPEKRTEEPHTQIDSAQKAANGDIL